MLLSIAVFAAFMVQVWIVSELKEINKTNRQLVKLEILAQKAKLGEGA